MRELETWLRVFGVLRVERVLHTRMKKLWMDPIGRYMQWLQCLMLCIAYVTVLRKIGPRG